MSSMVQYKKQVNLREILKRLLKYMVEGGAVAVVAWIVPNKKPSIEEVLIISITAAATFAVLDMFAPSIASSARQGTGFGLGANLAGGLVVQG